MKQLFLTILFSLLISPFGLATAGTEATTQDALSGSTAERQLRISGENAVTVHDILGRFQVLQTEGANVVDSAFVPIFLDAGISSREISVDVNYPLKTVMLRINLSQSNPARNDAGKAADQFISLFEDRFCEDNLHQLQSDKNQLVKIAIQKGELKDRHDDLAQALRKATGAMDVTPASVRDRMASLQTQKESAIIELAAKQARSDALAEQISKFSSQIQDKIKNDPIAAELAKVVDARQKEFDRAQAANKTGAATSGDVDQVMASLAEAKAKFLERQEAAANAAGGDIVSGWNRELMTLSVDIAELTARSKALDDRLAAYANADDYLDNADQWLAEINDLQKQESALQGKVSDEEAEYERNHVSIEVLKTPTDSTTLPSK